MGAPIPEMEPVENPSAEALLDSLKTIDPTERRKHASVFNYWQAIRGSRQLAPIRDLDPLEISDAGPWSVLLEMIGGGDDAVIRHFGQEIRGGQEVEKIADAPGGSLLACIHAKLPIVAACREALAFEDTYETEAGPGRCWVTLLPFSQSGTWIDYVYGYVSLECAEAVADDAPEAVAEEPEVAAAAEIAVEPAEVAPEPFKVELKALDEESEAGEDSPPPAATDPEPETEPEPEPEPGPDPEPEVAATANDEPPAEAEAEAEAESELSTKGSFPAKFLGGLASSFYGKVSQAAPGLAAEPAPEPAAELEAEPMLEAPVEPEPEPQLEPEPEHEREPEPEPKTASEPILESAHPVEGILHSKLSDVRTLAEQAREAQIRSNVALYEGLSAAYDFALDAENEPEEYLRLVEAQGLKIQLRSPMKPVVKLAFDGMCDEPTIHQLEAVLAWALKQDLPRGTLATRIQDEGGLGPILGSKAA